MNFFRKAGRYMLIIYMVQVLVGATIGVYLATTMDSTEIERIIGCVEY